MTNKVNKHIADSEDFFKKLKTGDTSGLDDFEKEAMEGFDSLENHSLAEKLNASLDKKIEDKYFKKNNNRFIYLSIAAGLVVVVGLSILFINYLASEKETLALSANSQNGDSVKRASELSFVAPEASKGKDLAAQPENKVVTGESLNATQTKKEENVPSDARSRFALAEKKNEPAADALAASGEGNNNEVSMNAGPPVTSAAAAPVVMEQQKAEKDEAPAKESSDKAAKQEAPAKVAVTSESAKNDDAKPGYFAQTKSNFKSKEAEADEKSQREESPARAKSAAIRHDAVASGGAVSQDDNSINYKISDAELDNEKNYIRKEIEKNAELKTYVKSFKATITVTKDDKVIRAKIITPFNDCTSCEKELERILLKMPAKTRNPNNSSESFEFVYP